jgi:hypothetical protein
VFDVIAEMQHGDRSGAGGSGSLRTVLELLSRAEAKIAAGDVDAARVLLAEIDVVLCSMRTNRSLRSPE